MHATVIIPHFNDVARLHKCLTALVPQLQGNDVEIVVGDNGSTQDITPLRDTFAEVRFVSETHPGAAAARNRAVQSARGKWLFFTDADCVPAENWIETALTVAKDDTCVGGRVSVFDETPPPRSGAEAFEHVFAFNQEAYIKQTHYSVTANMLVSRKMFDAVGSFDGSKSEDLDWGQRAYGMGYDIAYASELHVAHPTRQNWQALAKKWHRTTREMFAAHGTGPFQRIKWGLRSLLITASIVPHSVKVFRHQDLSLRDKCAALGMLVRLRLFRAGMTMRQAVFGQEPINQAPQKDRPKA